MVREFNPFRCLAALRAVDYDVSRLVEGVSEAQFHAPGPAGSWSIGFCLEHLILTGAANLARWESALNWTTSGHSILVYSWLQRTMLTAMEPPTRRKIKAPQSTEPVARRSRDDTVRRFFELERSIADCVERCADTDAAVRKIRSPFTWMRYPLGFSFDLELAHQRRHLWQAWQVRKHSARIATLAK